MSVFQFNSTFANSPVGVSPINVKVVANTATTIVSAASNKIFVPWFQVNEINGGTQNLTVDIYDGSAATYLGSDGGVSWVAKAVVAKTTYFFTQGYVIPYGSSLRVTSSDVSGYFHIIGTQIDLQN